MLNLLIRNAVVTFILMNSLFFFPSSVRAVGNPPELQSDPLLAAMRTELQRAGENLRLPEQPAPYVIE